MAYRYNVCQTNLQVNLTFETTVSNSNGGKNEEKAKILTVGLPVSLRQANGAAIRRDTEYGYIVEKKKKRPN